MAAQTSRSQLRKGQLKLGVGHPKTPWADGMVSKRVYEGDLQIIPPILEALGLAEVEHNPRNNRMQAV